MKKLLLGIALLSSANAVMAAEGPNWNYAALSYQSADFSGEKLNGFGITGSKLMGQNYFITGGYSTASADVSGVDLDLTTLGLGLGYRHAISDRSDLFGIAFLEKTDAKVSFLGESVDASNNDIDLMFGIRSMLTSQFEVLASAGYLVDASAISFSAKAGYHFNKSFALGAGYTTGDDVDTLELSAIFNF